MEFRRDLDIVREGELEATNYFFALPGEDDELELTFNHDGRTYENGTGYGHIAIGVDDLDGDARAARRSRGSSRSASPTGCARAAPALLRPRSGRLPRSRSSSAARSCFMDTQPHVFGPVQMLTIGFEGSRFKGEILPELERLKAAGVVRIIDLLVIRKDEAGAIAKLTRERPRLGGGDRVRRLRRLARSGWRKAARRASTAARSPVRPSSPTATSSTRTTRFGSRRRCRPARRRRWC